MVRGNRNGSPADGEPDVEDGDDTDKRKIGKCREEEVVGLGERASLERQMDHEVGNDEPADKAVSVLPEVVIPLT